MSLTMVRMNTASSHTSTVLPTLPPLFEDVLYQRFDVEHVHPSSFDFNDLCGNVRHRIESDPALELIDRYVMNVADIVHQNPSETLGVLHQQNQPGSSTAWRLAEHGSRIDHRHDGPTQVDQPAHSLRRGRQSRSPL